jgi:hypothetical protein
MSSACCSRLKYHALERASAATKKSPRKRGLHQFYECFNPGLAIAARAFADRPEDVRDRLPAGPFVTLENVWTAVS